MGVGARSVLYGSNAIGDHEEYLFFASLQTNGGVFKTTVARRMDDVNEMFAKTWSGGQQIDIQDVGASSGISTYEWQVDLISRDFKPAIVATDILIEGFLRKIAPGHFVLTDSAGRVLHHDIDEAVPANDDDLQSRRLRWLRKGARRVYYRVAHRRKPVKLVSPRARSILFVEEDIFLPNRSEFLGRFDVLRAANLLNFCYFPPDKIAAAIRNLKPRLKGAGSMLIVNRTHADGSNHGTLFRLIEGGAFVAVGQVGHGSEIAELVCAN